MMMARNISPSQIDERTGGLDKGENTVLGNGEHPVLRKGENTVLGKGENPVLHKGENTMQGKGEYPVLDKGENTMQGKGENPVLDKGENTTGQGKEFRPGKGWGGGYQGKETSAGQGRKHWAREGIQCDDNGEKTLP